VHGGDPRWTTPLPSVLGDLAARHRLTVTVEDNAATGGLGQRLAHLPAGRDHPPRLRDTRLPGRARPRHPRQHRLEPVRRARVTEQHDLDERSLPTVPANAWWWDLAT
jgi:deoxyxylulose-5-phosphate synthase